MELGVEYDPEFGRADCELSPEWVRAAEVNVNDDEAGRPERIASFRRKLKKAGLDLRPGDDHQLLGILRSANSDVDHAVGVAKAFLEYQEYCGDTLPALMNDMIWDNSKLFMALPHRDRKGRRVLAYRMWNAEKYPYQEIMKVFYVVCMTLAREPKTQIAGITLVGDMSGMTRKHIPVSWADITAWSNFMKGGCPVWFHTIHIVNAPWLFETIYAMAKPFLSDHARGNVVLHKKKERAALHAEVGDEILPEELGGRAGEIDNSGCVENVIKLDSYFQELVKSRKI